MRTTLKRRPTGVRIVFPDGYADSSRMAHLVSPKPLRRAKDNERTPLIKAGVKPDIRRTSEDVTNYADMINRGTQGGLGKMVELGLPLIMSVQRRGISQKWT